MFKLHIKTYIFLDLNLTGRFLFLFFPYNETSLEKEEGKRLNDKKIVILILPSKTKSNGWMDG